MRKTILFITASILIGLALPCFAQVNTVRLKVSKHSKSNTKTNTKTKSMSAKSGKAAKVARAKRR